ncbi:MAG: flippase [Pyrinomonadaceae bacterium]
MFRTLFSNFFSLAGAEAFTKLITFAAFAYLARLCGPAGFGYVEWAASVLMCSSLVVDQGFSMYGAREIAKSPGETSRLVSEVVTARILLALVAYMAIAIFALWFVSDQAVTVLLLVYGLSLLAMPFLLQWVFQGHDRMHLVSITQIVRQTIFVLVVFAFVAGLRDLVWVGIAEVAGVTAAAAFSLWVYRRYFSKQGKVFLALSPKLFREGAPIGLSQMFWVIKMFGATFVVGLIATAEDTGYFAGAMRIYIALHTFVWLYFFNMLPSMSRAWQQSPEKLTGIIKNSLRIVAVASLIVGIIWVMSAPLIMTTAYGPSFSPGGGALQLLAGACIAAAISGHYRYGLIASGSQRNEMIAMAVGSLAALALIPVGYFNMGTNGAAAALFFAEIVVLIFSWMFFRRALLKHDRVGEVTTESFDSLRRVAI